MTFRLLPVLGAAALLLACQAPAPLPPSGAFTAEQAIQGAASRDEGLAGVFELPVRNVGLGEGRVFLNSETDYRDPRCVTVVVPGTVFDAWSRQQGLAGPDALKGRRIRVRGVARRVKVHFVAQGRVTDKYYFQTHVLVDRPEALERR